MLKAYGGAEAIGKVVSVTARGRITEFLSGKRGNYARYLDRPGKLRIEVMLLSSSNMAGNSDTTVAMHICC